MSLRRGLKWILIVSIVGLAGEFAVAHPDIIKGYYEDVYPNDPGKRQALEMCFQEDHKFNRLDPDERDACYKRALLAPPPTEASLPMTVIDRPAVNEIDLRRAAGAGHMPRNDIRRPDPGLVH